jgi:hypothetical protein
MATYDQTNPEIIGLAEQKALAKALLQKGMNQNLQGQMVSGRYVGASPLEGLANLLNIYAGQKSSENLAQKEKNIIQQQQMAQNANLQQGLNEFYGTPEFTQQGPTPTGGNIPVQPAMPANRQTALATLLAPAGGATSKAIAAKLIEKEFEVPKTPEDVAKYNFAKTPEGGGFKGSFNDFQNQMTDYQRKHLGVLAANQGQSRVPMGYRMKQDGSLEAIPGGPADQKAQTIDVGRQTVDTLITGLKDKYNLLKESGGITSTSQGAFSNVPAYLSSSGIGQTFGKTFATENQSARNTIAQSRPLLLQAIARATGMSSKQMDSNTELQMYLKAATDPTLDYEANTYALNQLQTLYGLGGTAPVVGGGGGVPSASDIDAEIARRKKK